MYIIVALLVLGLLITIHELGHFIMAKANNVKVEEFSIGMGPELKKIQGKETQYSIRLFPIGGYVKMYGEEEDTGDPRAFMSKKPLQRISIVAAGVIMNFLLAIFLFSMVTLANGYVKPNISEVVANSPAEAAGLKPGDIITEVNSNKVWTFSDLSLHVFISEGNPVEIKYTRQGKDYKATITPAFNKDEAAYQIGVAPTLEEKPGIGESLSEGFKKSVSTINQVVYSIKTIFAGKASLNDVGGPVSIIRISGAAAKAGIWNLLSLAAMLSVQLSIFNLIPFPALDGGWLLFLLIELITRRKVSDKIVQAANLVGISILFLLMILVTIKDILFPIAL
ncbi:RIP metalloprotease RseP [Alloiococcus sp. CFN-8]|uniref:RIP metalloprotease RseP n=1 Tax=Alloiococcus sp. CFN-8 TaxID=3416081 RepID=UPI003CEB62CE